MTAANRSMMILVAFAMVLVSATAAGATSTTQRPFREQLTGGVTALVIADDFEAGDTFGGRCSEPSQMLISFAGIGNVRHLGRVSWTTEHCSQLFAGTFGDAKLVITASNGDELSGTYGGYQTGETTFADDMTITGGTGRFAGATGKVAETGTFDPVTLEIGIRGEGWISYDASRKTAS